MSFGSQMSISINAAWMQAANFFHPALSLTMLAVSWLRAKQSTRLMPDDPYASLHCGCSNVDHPTNCRKHKGLHFRTTPKIYERFVVICWNRKEPTNRLRKRILSSVFWAFHWNYQDISWWLLDSKVARFLQKVRWLELDYCSPEVDTTPVRSILL